jgi:CBS domain-containing protein
MTMRDLAVSLLPRIWRTGYLRNYVLFISVLKLRQVSAEGLDPHITPVSQIMTRSPMVTRDTTSATEALQLMVQKHFRHLVCLDSFFRCLGLLISSSARL